MVNKAVAVGAPPAFTFRAIFIAVPDNVRRWAGKSSFATVFPPQLACTCGDTDLDELEEDEEEDDDLLSFAASALR